MSNFRFYGVGCAQETSVSLPAITISQEDEAIIDRLVSGRMGPGCTRSHPHEKMNHECELLTEIARRRAQKASGESK